MFIRSPDHHVMAALVQLSPIDEPEVRGIVIRPLEGAGRCSEQEDQKTRQVARAAAGKAGDGDARRCIRWLRELGLITYPLFPPP